MGGTRSPLPATPEQRARENIDAALVAAGWVVQDRAEVNLEAGPGVAVREFPMKAGHGEADYLLFVDGGAAGVLEAKPAGTGLAGVEVQAEKYSAGLHDYLTAPVTPLPFLYLSTGEETRFANGLDPHPTYRKLFHIHRPETLRGWLAEPPLGGGARPSSFVARVEAMPSLNEAGLWPAQVRAVRALEESLARNNRRSLIQMATGSGKTFTSITALYRLIKFGGARRVLFLVDRANLGRQAHKEFQAYKAPGDGRSFTELYITQRLASPSVNPDAKVVIGTIQRIYSILSGSELDEQLEEGSAFDGGQLLRSPATVAYNPAIPPDFFDLIVIDECHRSIYTLWSQVLTYFDAFLVGLTATPGKHTIAFFQRNLVMEYGHAAAVADGVNVDFDVYKLRTRITGQGATIEGGPLEVVTHRDRLTRAERLQGLDDDIVYTPAQLDREVVAEDQIRTIFTHLRDHLPVLFPGRTHWPKTIVFAKDDSHAEDVTHIIREVFGKGNAFCEKITYRSGTVRDVTINAGGEEEVTYRSSGIKPEDHLKAFRNSYNPRIAVTVDMIATGTDIKPVEMLVFLRTVKSLTLFEQMKGRGVRIIDPNDLRAVTPDARGKSHFLIVDCVGVCEQPKVQTTPIEKKRSASFKQLLEQVAFGARDEATLSSLASRLTRLEHQLDPEESRQVRQKADGRDLLDMARGLLDAFDPDVQVERARADNALPSTALPDPVQIAAAARSLANDAAAPIATSPDLRNTLLELKTRADQIIDRFNLDEVIEAGTSAEARQKAESLITNFRTFIDTHRDELTALQILYDQPSGARLRWDDLRDLADALRTPHGLTPEKLWHAYEILERDRVRGAGRERLLTDIVSLVRHALARDSELVPFHERVADRFDQWLARRHTSGEDFTAEQRRWLEMIRDHVAASCEMTMEDFDSAPFAQEGGLGRVWKLFGEDLEEVVKELNEVLVA